MMSAISGSIFGLKFISRLHPLNALNNFIHRLFTGYCPFTRFEFLRFPFAHVVPAHSLLKFTNLLFLTLV